MSNRDLLKEAIADAKAVKEMAISNAKAALEEAFTPKLKSMLEKKLTEMEDEDEKKMEEAKMHDSEKEMKEEMHDDDTMSEEELNELLSELEEEEESEEAEEAEEEETESEEEEEEEDFDLEEMSEEDLKAFIEDVVDEMIEAGELEAGEEEMEAPEMEAPEMEPSEEEPMMENTEQVNEVIGTAALIVGALAALAGGAIAKTYKSFKDEQKAATEKMTAELIGKGVDPEQAVKQAVDQVGASMSAAPGSGKYAGAKGGFNPVSNLEEGAEDEIAAALNKVHDDKSLDSEPEIKKALADLEKKVHEGADLEEGQINEGYGVFLPIIKMIAAKFGIGMAGATVVAGMIPFTAIATGAVTAVMIAKAVKAYKEKKAAGDLAEALKTVEILKTELNEVNLLNSKLLYTNKIFKAKNLTEAQKVKVLTTFDKAETVKEVKLIYETLSEGMVAKKEAIKESKSYASKAVGVSPKQPVVETNDMVNRFKKLAGLK